MNDERHTGGLRYSRVLLVVILDEEPRALVYEALSATSKRAVIVKLYRRIIAKSRSRRVVDPLATILTESKRSKVSMPKVIYTII